MNLHAITSNRFQLTIDFLNYYYQNRDYTFEPGPNNTIIEHRLVDHRTRTISDWTVSWWTLRAQRWNARRRPDINNNDALMAL